MLRSGLPLLALALLLPGCAVHDDFSKSYLQPNTTWVADPADLGLPAVAADIDGRGVRIHGFLIPAAAARGRTVVLFHGSGTNASELHPYYAFLHDAGFNVFAFDYRGFGQSQGEASLHGLVSDLPMVLDWLQARPEVDRAQLAFYGFGIGAAVALRAAASLADVRALVLEDVASPRDDIHDAAERDHGGLSAAVITGLTEFSAVPEDLEPDDNAARTKVPVLFLGGAELPRTDLRAMLRTYLRAGGDKQLWVMPGTGPAPEALATQDGEYQRRIAAFLRGAFAGAPERLQVEWQPAATGKDGVWYDVALTRRGGDASPWAVELCAVDADGAATFQRVWLEGEHGTFKLRAPRPPGVVGAARCLEPVGTDDGGWQPTPSAMASSLQAYAQVLDDVELLRHGEPDAARTAAIAARIAALRSAHPFHPRLDAELADAYSQIGRRLLRSGAAADRAAARGWLQLAVDSAPAQPRLHYWPSRNPTFGYPQQPAVDAARELLQSAPGS